MNDLTYIDLFEEDDSDEFGLWDGQCAGCDDYGRVNDLGLCAECTDKLDRDMIRNRDWEYSATAWACPKEKREALRKEVIRTYGAKLELIAPSGDSKTQKKTRSKPKKKGSKKERRKARHERYLREGK